MRAGRRLSFIVLGALLAALPPCGSEPNPPSERDVDSAALSPAAPAAMPDLLIKAAEERDSAYALNDVYQASPQGAQARSSSVNPGAKAVYQVKVQNDGTALASYRVYPIEVRPTGWSIVYKVGAADVTGQVRAGRRLTRVMAAGGSEILTVELVPGYGAAGGSYCSVTLRACLSTSDARARDSVRATARVNTVTPDLLIKGAGEPETAYTQDNVYQASPQGAQVRSSALSTGAKAVYYVKVQNDSAVPAALVVRPVEALAAGWSASYKVGAADITGQMRAGGHQTPLLAPRASVILNIELTPGPSAVGASLGTVTLRVFRSPSDILVRDSVRASARVNTIAQPDLLIWRPFGPPVSLDSNVYQTTPTGDQVATQQTDQGSAASYQVLLENDGNTTRGFVLRAAEANAGGWTTTYKSGDLDVSAQIRGKAGLATAPLAPGGSVVITVAMMPSTAAIAGTPAATTIRALLRATDAAAGDAVQAASSVRGVDRPDLLIKNAAEPESAFALEGVYQSSPSGKQARGQVTARDTGASFQVKVCNRGNTVRRFVLKATEHGSSGWESAYTLEGTDVTADMKGAAGLSTGVLAPGASQALDVTATPSDAVADGSTRTITVTAHLDATSTTIRDAVKATVAVTPRNDAQPPTVASATVTPTHLPSEGGSVTISAVITDQSGIGWVQATVQGSGFAAAVPLALASENTYSATYMLPANPSSRTARYAFSLTGADTRGNVTPSLPLGSVAVAASAPEVTARAALTGNRRPCALVTWTIAAFDTDILGYQIYRSTTQYGEYEPVGEVDGATETRFQDVPDTRTVEFTQEGPVGSGGTVDTEEIGVLGVMPGVTYYYRVRALVLEEGMTEGGAVQVVRRTDPSAPTGGATPVYAPVLCSPLDGAAVTPSQIAFRWFSVDGGDRYRLEVSNTPTFDAERTVRSLDEDRRFSLPGGVGTRTMSAVVNVADAFPQAQYLFWRIGALHSADAVAPEGGFIFATAGSVSVPEMPPLPAGRRQ